MRQKTDIHAGLACSYKQAVCPTDGNFKENSMVQEIYLWTFFIVIIVPIIVYIKCISCESEWYRCLSFFFSNFFFHNKNMYLLF